MLTGSIYDTPEPDPNPPDERDRDADYEAMLAAEDAHYEDARESGEDDLNYV